MAKSQKLPKRIAGVKIPKKVRKTGGKIKDFADRNPIFANIAADVIAAGLLAAADAASRTKPAKKAGKKAKHAAADAGEATAKGAFTAADVLAYVARETAKAIRKR